MQVPPTHSHPHPRGRSGGWDVSGLAIGLPLGAQDPIKIKGLASAIDSHCRPSGCQGQGRELRQGQEQELRQGQGQGRGRVWMLRGDQGWGVSLKVTWSGFDGSWKAAYCSLRNKISCLLNLRCRTGTYTAMQCIGRMMFNCRCEPQPRKVILLGQLPREQ